MNTESMTPAEILAECKAVSELLPPHRSNNTHCSICDDSSGGQVAVTVSPAGGYNDTYKVFFARTFAEAFAQAREWASAHQGRRREAAEKKLAEAQAELAALDAESDSAGSPSPAAY